MNESEIHLDSQSSESIVPPNRTRPNKEEYKVYSHGIGDAMRFIRNGNADIMLAGSGESCIDLLSIAGFCRIRALITAFNEIPNQASRPFDMNRDGFVMGEGAAILLLERIEHALQLPFINTIGNAAAVTRCSRNYHQQL
uniref:beta-ketoacyl-[acyl-carrier-protein] synthase I n=1 Tax=Glossina palpalis gambiensis TaxID=67801 RepID=A0A1B0APW2_9MUSC